MTILKKIKNLKKILIVLLLLLIICIWILWYKLYVNNYLNDTSSSSDNLNLEMLNVKENDNIDMTLFTEFENLEESKYENFLLYDYEYSITTVEEGWIYDYDFEVWDNIDMEKSSFELYFSNDNLEKLQNIISLFPQKIDWTLEDIISLLYIKNLYIPSKDIIFNSKLNNEQSNDDILKQIYSFQNYDGWFKEYLSDKESSIEISFFVSDILKKLNDLWITIDEKILVKLEDFLIDKESQATEKYMKLLMNKYENSQITIIEKSNLLSFLIDSNYDDINYIKKIIWELNQINVKNPFISYKTKSYVFEAILKYVNKYSKNTKKTKFGFMLWNIRNPETPFWVWRVTSSFKHYFYTTKDTFYNNKASFRVVNLEGVSMNVWIFFKRYYSIFDNVLKSDELEISRKIYNISSLNDLKKCYLSWDLNCNKVYIKKEDNIFEKWNIYKVELNLKNISGDEIIVNNFIPENFEFVNIDEKYKVLNTRSINYEKNNLRLVFDKDKESIKFTYYIKAIENWIWTYFWALWYSKDNYEVVTSTESFEIEVK